MRTRLTQVDYRAIEAERLSEIQRSLTERLSNARDVGYGDSLRNLVLSRVATGDYDAARRYLNDYIEVKKDFPGFQQRVESYRRYASDLINAIEAKRGFQGLGSLPLAKQQELYEKVLEHFEDLKGNLKHIERHDKEARLDDIRSTVWVVKALANSVFFVVAVAFSVDIQSGLADSFLMVFDSFLRDLTNALFTVIGW